METPALLPYKPPQPAFRRCKCGQLVLRLGKGHYVTPLLGYPHVCTVKEHAA